MQRHEFHMGGPAELVNHLDPVKPYPAADQPRVSRANVAGLQDTWAMRGTGLANSATCAAAPARGGSITTRRTAPVLRQQTGCGTGRAPLVVTRAAPAPCASRDPAHWIMSRRRPRRHAPRRPWPGAAQRCRSPQTDPHALCPVRASHPGHQRGPPRRAWLAGTHRAAGHPPGQGSTGGRRCSNLVPGPGDAAPGRIPAARLGQRLVQAYPSACRPSPPRPAPCRSVTRTDSSPLRDAPSTASASTIGRPPPGGMHQAGNPAPTMIVSDAFMWKPGQRAFLGAAHRKGARAARLRRRGDRGRQINRDAPARPAPAHHVSLPVGHEPSAACCNWHPPQDLAWGRAV